MGRDGLDTFSTNDNSDLYFLISIWLRMLWSLFLFKLKFSSCKSALVASLHSTQADTSLSLNLTMSLCPNPSSFLSSNNMREKTFYNSLWSSIKISPLQIILRRAKHVVDKYFGLTNNNEQEVQSYENGFTHRKDPHLFGGTSVSVLGLVLLREVRSQECLRTRGVGEFRWLLLRSLLVKRTGQMTKVTNN